MGILHTLGAPGRDTPGAPLGASGHGKMGVKAQELCAGGGGRGELVPARVLLAMRMQPQWGPP